MAYIRTVSFTILVASIYHVSGLPSRGNNEHVYPQDSTIYYWKNCQHLYQDLHGDMIAVDREYIPREKYFKLVLKVYVAFTRGLLERIRGSWSSDSVGKHTELYVIPECYQELVLPSIRDYRDAITYLQNSNEQKSRRPPNLSNDRKSETIVDDSSDLSSSLESVFSNTYNDNPVIDMQIDMLEICIDSVPGEKYYKLVLKVDEAIRQGLIKPVGWAYHASRKGIHTEIYKVTKTNEELRLPSVHKVREAKLYLKTIKKENIEKNTKRFGQEKTQKQTAHNRKSQYNYKKSDSSSSTFEDREVHIYTSQGRRPKLTDDEKIIILNRKILRQEKEKQQQGYN